MHTFDSTVAKAVLKQAMQAVVVVMLAAVRKRVAEFKLAEGAPKVVLHNPVAVRALAMGLAIAQMVVPITAVDSNPAVSAAHQVVLAARNPAVVVLVLGFHKSASI